MTRYVLGHLRRAAFDSAASALVRAVGSATMGVDEVAADEALRDYLAFHGPRFEYMLQLVEDYHKPSGSLLDIGASEFTELLQDTIGSGSQIDALGLGVDTPTQFGRYFGFDLNRCQHSETRRHDLPKYDTIVFAEVLEHLYTSPALVLDWLAERLNPDGVLILLTPNAVALPRRLGMLRGDNPFELIRVDSTNPGHYREYTAAELRTYLDGAGLAVEHLECRSYFDFRWSHHGMSTRRRQLAGSCKNLIYPRLPQSWRPGLAAVARRS